MFARFPNFSLVPSESPSDSSLLRVACCLPDVGIGLKDVLFESAGDFPPRPPSHMLSQLDAARAEAAPVAVCGLCHPVCEPAHNWHLL